MSLEDEMTDIEERLEGSGSYSLQEEIEKAFKSGVRYGLTKNETFEYDGNENEINRACIKYINEYF